jgi:hypothetical protein
MAGPVSTGPSILPLNDFWPAAVLCRRDFDLGHIRVPDLGHPIQLVHGSMELDWSFPMVKWIRGFVQYFNGYGEVLLNYNERVQRIGVGFLLADWL